MTPLSTQTDIRQDHAPFAKQRCGLTVGGMREHDPSPALLWLGWDARRQGEGVTRFHRVNTISGQVRGALRVSSGRDHG